MTEEWVGLGGLDLGLEGFELQVHTTWKLASYLSLSARKVR